MRAELSAIVDAFSGCKVLVVGDLMLDRYIFGSVDRISPEAPVPVVDVQREEQVLGGAANVAANLASLGAQVELLSIVGDDAAGERVRALMDETKIGKEALVVSSRRPTTQKTRVLAGQQQLVRIDREKRQAPDDSEQGALEAILLAKISEVDAILISDYGKGVIQPRLLDFLRKARSEMDSPPPVIVDPKDIHFSNYRSFTLVTPNKKEAALAAGYTFPQEEDLRKAGRELRERNALQYLLITRGAEGMTLFSDGEPANIKTMAREVYDVSGAGDTVAALMTLGLAAGAKPVQAAYLANAAAAVVVGRVGTAIIDLPSLVKSIETIESEECL